eukprot:2642273-Amphidinium_carterae.1
MPTLGILVREIPPSKVASNLHWGHKMPTSMNDQVHEKPTSSSRNAYSYTPIAIVIICVATFELGQRGRLEDGATENMMVERLLWACEKSAENGVRLLVEPLNSTDFPGGSPVHERICPDYQSNLNPRFVGGIKQSFDRGYLVPDVATAQRILTSVGKPTQCMLQLDLYHLAMTAGKEAVQGANAIQIVYESSVLLNGQKL